MTDIMFLLLIFFMLTVSFITPTGLTVELPASHTTNPLVPQVHVTITSALDYYIDGQETTLGQLERILAERLNAQNGSLLLEVDKSVPIEHMVKVADIASSLHAKVSVATRTTHNGGT